MSQYIKKKSTVDQREVKGDLRSLHCLRNDENTNVHHTVESQGCTLLSPR